MTNAPTLSTLYPGIWNTTIELDIEAAGMM